MKHFSGFPELLGLQPESLSAPPPPSRIVSFHSPSSLSGLHAHPYSVVCPLSFLQLPECPCCLLPRGPCTCCPLCLDKSPLSCASLCAPGLSLGSQPRPASPGIESLTSTPRPFILPSCRTFCLFSRALSTLVTVLSWRVISFSPWLD